MEFIFKKEDDSLVKIWSKILYTQHVYIYSNNLILLVERRNLKNTKTKSSSKFVRSFREETEGLKRRLEKKLVLLLLLLLEQFSS